MNIIKKVIELLKKIGVLRVGVEGKTYTNAKDRLDVDPLEDR